jgi:hypothetical protein
MSIQILGPNEFAPRSSPTTSGSSNFHGEPLSFRPAAGKFHFENKSIIAAEIRFRLVQRNITGHFERQTLLVVGGADLGFPDRNFAMSRRGAEAYRREWTGRAIGLDIDIDADPKALASLTLGSAINGFVLSRGQGTKPKKHHKCQTHRFHITPPQSTVTVLWPTPSLSRGALDRVGGHPDQIIRCIAFC